MAYLQAPAEMPALHALTTGLQAKQDDPKDPCPQVNMQCLWPEASWLGLEQIHGQGHVQNRLHTE